MRAIYTVHLFFSLFFLFFILFFTFLFSIGLIATHHIDIYIYIYTGAPCY